VSTASQTFIVTGATGIAAAVVRSLIEAGSEVVVITNDSHQVEDLRAGLPRDAPVVGVVADLSDEVSADRAFREASELAGEVRGVVGVAGGSGRRFGDGDIANIDLRAWQATLDMNLTPAFLTLRNAVRLIVPPGGVVLISSVLAQFPEDRHFRTHAYAAAKGAINSLVSSVAAAYATKGISINAVAPGLVRTPMSQRAVEDLEIQEYIRSKQPLAPTFLSAESISQAVISLLENPAITGQTITVDGGWSVTSR